LDAGCGPVAAGDPDGDTGAMIAYLAFELFRACKRQKQRERAEANRPPNSN
jgi:hypothetical protein